MNDFRDQLAARFGAAVPAPTPSEAPPADHPLSPEAHRSSAWFACLRALGPRVQQAVKPDLSLPAAHQVTDRTLKALKQSGMRREHAELDKARSEYQKKREKIAWAALKEALTDRGGSPKAYRALKQSGVDPERALKALARISDDIATYSAARLRDALAG